MSDIEITHLDPADGFEFDDAYSEGLLGLADDLAALDQDTSLELGEVYLPAEPGTGVGEFQFIVDPDQVDAVEVGSMVSADTLDGTFVGSIVDMRTVGTASSPIRTELAGSLTDEMISKTPISRVATVSVFHSPARRPIVAGRVRPATADEVSVATGRPAMKWPIPVGAKELVGGGLVQACLDGDYLLGPEGGHLLALGTSGLAAKTSQTSVLLSSAIAHGGPDHGKPNVAALMFSPKSDLLFLDQPPAAGEEPNAFDQQLYAAMGTPATPFADLEVFAPGLPGSHEVNSVRADAMPVRLGLKDAIGEGGLRFWFPWAGEDEKLMSFFAAFEARKLNSPSVREKITTFAEFDQFCQTEIETAEAENSSICWGNTHVATLHRIRRMVMGLVARSKGLLTSGRPGPADDIPVDNFTHGTVRVVDIAALPLDARAFLIARTLTRLLVQAEEGRLGNTRVVVYIDELNEMFGPDSPRPLRGLIQRVVSQGRYAGVSLIGAAQRTSGTKLSELMVNMATTLVGRTTDTELSSGSYGRIKPGLAETIVTLPKGQTTVFHYSYRAPMVVNFPRPAWRTGPPKFGEDGYRAKPTVASTLTDARVRDGVAVPASQRVSLKGLERLTEGLDPEVVEQVIAAADDQATAIEMLRKHREPDMAKTELVAEVPDDRDNPFGLDD